MNEKALATINYVAIISTLQEIPNEEPTEMNMPPQETIMRLLK